MAGLMITEALADSLNEEGRLRLLVDALETIAIRHASVANPKLFEAMKVSAIQDSQERQLNFMGRPEIKRWLDAFWDAHYAALDLKSGRLTDRERATMEG